MLGGSVITGFISYYLNAYYSGRFLNYSIKEQIKDILPSFLVATAMAVSVFMLSFINLKPLLLLLVQLATGLILTVALCEITKLEAYIELKNILLSYTSKMKNGK